MNKNHDHVAVYTDRPTMYWALILPSDAETCEAQTREMVGICERLFRTFDEFLTPTQVEFHVPCFPAGHELPASIHDENKSRTVHRELHNPEGISVEEVVSATRVDDCPSRWLPRIAFNGSKVLVELENGPVVADRTDHTVEYRKNKPVDNGPDRDPIEVVLLHGPNSWESEIDSEFNTSVLVNPLSDLWFDDTEIGRANATRLRAFLQRIDDTLPVEKIERTSDWLPVEQLEAIY